MTDTEWEEIEALLCNWWGGEFTAQASAAYRLALNRFPAAEVARALGESLERGSANGWRGRPSAADLMGHLVPQTSQHPAWGETWELIEEAIRRFGCSVYSPRFEERHQEAIDWLARRDEVVAAFAARRGLMGGPGTLGHEPVGDPGFGGAVRARIAKDWQETVQVAAEREARGLPPVDPKQLRVSAMREVGGGMAGVVERLRPAPELAESNE